MPQERPTTRVLAMLELLQARRSVSGRDLAAHLGVDERTVRRYAVHLTDLGIPVIAERGRYGGYRLLPGFKLPPLMLSDDEASAVVLSLQAGGRMGLPATTTALAKIQRVLPEAVRAQVEALRTTLTFTFPERDATPAPDAQTLLALAAAAQQGRRVTIAYRSWDGRDSDRDLDPYGLVLHAGRWYVSGLDHRSGQIRTFRIDRIAALHAHGATFQPPDDFNPAAHVTAGLGQVPYTHEVEVIFETGLEEARRRLPPQAGTLTAAGEGRVLLQARAERLDGMARMLAGLGWPFTVRRPEALREEIIALGRRLADYGGREADFDP